MKIVFMKSFTYNNKGGNPAGVVLLDKYVEDKEMQRIAYEIGFSETAFVKQIGENIFDVRFFTPACEVDLCGHATIAAFFYLAKEGIIIRKNKKSTAYQNTKVGKLKIEINYDNNRVTSVMMQQAEPLEFGIIDGTKETEIAKSLNINKNDIKLELFDIKPTIVSTGLKDIVIPIKSRELLNSLQPDLEHIFNISNKENVVGYHVYTIDNNQIYARNFAPAVGINEECATGTSNGALSYLLYKNRIVNNYIEIIQGEAMNEKSLICCEIKEEKEGYIVKVGGKAVEIINKVLDKINSDEI